MSFDSKNQIEKPVKKTVKLIAILIIIGIIATTIFALYSNNLLDFGSDNVILEYDNPSILSAFTIDNNSFKNISSTILNGKEPAETLEFERGDPVYIYYRFSNITHKKKYDIIEEIKIYYADNLINSYYEKILGSSSTDEMYDTYMFKTNKSMSLGIYKVKIHLKDDISNKTVSKNIGFVLNEETPEILVLTTASKVNGYQDYTPENNFTKQDNIFIYTEYTNIQTTNQNTQCNLKIKMNITTNQKEYYTTQLNKTTVKNNAHYWNITTNNTWATNTIYTVNLYLFDKNLLKSVTSQTFFTLV